MRREDAEENTVKAMIRTISATNGKLSVKEGESDNIKVTSEIKSKTGEIISENCTLTLPEINVRLQKELPFEEKFTTKIFERILNGLFYTVKDTVVHPYEGNCRRTKAAREEYADFFLETRNLTTHHNLLTKKDLMSAQIEEKVLRFFLTTRCVIM